MKKSLLITLFISIIYFSCSEEIKPEQPDLTAPKVVSTTPANQAQNVPLNTEITVEYDENIRIDGNYAITVNGKQALVSGFEKKLTITTVLAQRTNYEVVISNKSIKDAAGNYASEVKFSFSSDPGDLSIYEAEEANLSANLTIEKTISGYSGNGYVAAFANSSDVLTFNIKNIVKGNYDLNIGYTTGNWGAKWATIEVNESGGSLELQASSTFKKTKYATVKLLDGENTIKISPSWTHFAIDYIQLLPSTAPEIPFSIDVNLVTLTPSVEAKNVYNFLKTNFGQKVISGTMANYSTNTAEAEWVQTQTGKYPALIGMDLIDYTQDWSWVNYTEIVSNSKTHWQNNGLVTLMWHWRDPSRKTAEFYTDKTNFDITKINDPNSAEYKAMIDDIDIIAGYLKQLKEANVPVLWRPLHEAAGGWFWWGAKGAEPCKTLWRILFDRLVNHHQLNNLIWVWTIEPDAQAMNWYPGHEYVDIVGLDIYPGENKHGSQYTKFDKTKAITGGRKIITLSECGSAPDPALMKQYGDMWSWFMPWNGTFTRDEKHNGATWWNKFFSYDFVLTLDKMPNLKAK